MNSDLKRPIFSPFQILFKFTKHVRKQSSVKWECAASALLTLTFLRWSVSEGESDVAACDLLYGNEDLQRGEESEVTADLGSSPLNCKACFWRRTIYMDGVQHDVLALHTFCTVPIGIIRLSTAWSFYHLLPVTIYKSSLLSILRKRDWGLAFVSYLSTSSFREPRLYSRLHSHSHSQAGRISEGDHSAVDHGFGV